MNHFNALTPAEAERLALLAEECGECIQAIGKILRHGYASNNPLEKSRPNPDNRQRLEREIGDVMTAIAFMFEADDVNEAKVYQHADDKRERVQKYLHHFTNDAGVES